MAFDPEPLARDLAGLDGWIAHFVQQNYDGDWSVLPLRGTAGAKHPVMAIYPDPTATSFEDTPLLARCPNIAAALARFECPLHFVRLMRLTPGSVIKEHRDLDLDAENGMVRLHLPIVTNPQVVFEVNRRPVALEPGSVWYLRLSDPHRVSNNGTADRVHLVIDAPLNDWLGRMLQRASAASPVS
jgi:hypothetical protein